MKWRSPARQSIRRSLVRKLATIIRARFVQPARPSELTHRGVDDRVAGHAVLPCLEAGVIVLPCDVAVALVDRLARDTRRVPERVGVEVAPRELRHEATRSIATLVGRERPRRDLDRGKKAEPQVGTESGGSERVAQIVAGSVVRGGTAGLEPRLKPTTRGGFARLGQRILVGRRAIETEGREVGGGAIVGVDGRDRRCGKDITDRVHLPSPEERSEDAVRRSRLCQDVCPVRG